MCLAAYLIRPRHLQGNGVSYAVITRKHDEAKPNNNNNTVLWRKSNSHDRGRQN